MDLMMQSMNQPTRVRESTSTVMQKDKEKIEKESLQKIEIDKKELQSSKEIQLKINLKQYKKNEDKKEPKKKRQAAKYRKFRGNNENKPSHKSTKTNSKFEYSAYDTKSIRSKISQLTSNMSNAQRVLLNKHSIKSPEDGSTGFGELQKMVTDSQYQDLDELKHELENKLVKKGKQAGKIQEEINYQINAIERKKLIKIVRQKNIDRFLN